MFICTLGLKLRDGQIELKSISDREKLYLPDALNQKNNIVSITFLNMENTYIYITRENYNRDFQTSNLFVPNFCARDLIFGIFLPCLLINFQPYQI